MPSGIGKKTVGREGIQVRRLDLGTVAPNVGETKIVGHDEHEVGSLGGNDADRPEAAEGKDE